MRTMITAAALVLTASAAPAQPTRAFEGGPSLDTGREEMWFNENSANYRRHVATVNSQNQDLQAKAAAANKMVNRLTDEREQWLGRYQIYENVISLRKKDAVLAAVDEARKKLGVSEVEGYQRLGKYNPFTTESYVRYFDPKTGELVMAEVRQSYQNLEVIRKEFNQECQRARAAQAEVSESYNRVLASYQKARDAKRELDKAQDALAAARAEAARAAAEQQRLQMEAAARAAAENQGPSPPGRTWTPEDDSYYKRYGSVRPGYAR